METGRKVIGIGTFTPDKFYQLGHRFGVLSKRKDMLDEMKVEIMSKLKWIEGVQLKEDTPIHEFNPSSGEEVTISEAYGVLAKRHSTVCDLIDNINIELLGITDFMKSRYVAERLKGNNPLPPYKAAP